MKDRVVGNSLLCVLAILVVATFGSGIAFSSGDVQKEKKTPVTLTIADVWALAERHHPRIVEAKQRLTSARRDVEGRESVYAPTLNVSGSGLSLQVDSDGEVRPGTPGASLSASKKFPSGLSLSGSLTARSQTEQSSRSSSASPLTGSVSATYPLFRSAPLESDALALRQAEAGLAVARRRSDQARDEVRADVLDALHGEQVAAARLQLAREQHDDARRNWDRAQQQVEAGMLTEVERLGAELDWLRAEQELLVAERTWESRRDQLLRLLDLDGGAVYEFESILEWTALPEPGSIDDALVKALQQSVAVWEQREAEDVARLQFEDERTRSRLDANIQGQYQSRSRSTGESDTQSSGAPWQITLQLSYPLADGGQKKRALESRREAYEKAVEAREAAERDVQEQLEELLQHMEDGLRSIEIARLELRRAELEFASVKKQADLPVAAVTEAAVRQRERDVERAGLNLSEAIRGYQSDWIAWQRLQGDVPWEQIVGRKSGGDY